MLVARRFAVPPRWLLTLLAALFVVAATRAPAIAAPRLVRTSQSGGAARPFVDSRRYVGARDAGLALLRRFPVSTHYILGIGRSPTPVITFLKNLALERAPFSGQVTSIASSIPASGLRLGVGQNQRRALFRHLERFLPEDVLRGERTLVLVDSVATGTSVRTMAQMVRQYWQAHGVTTGRIVRSGFHRRVAPQGFASFQLARFPGAVISDGGQVAEFPSHVIGGFGGRLIDLVANSRYAIYSRRMRATMAADPELDGVLTGELAHLTVRPARP